jgi:hypothetical protein
MAQVAPAHSTQVEDARDALVKARADPKTPAWIVAYLEQNHERLQMTSSAILTATSVLKSLGSGDEAERYMTTLIAKTAYHRQLVRRD